jgi:hypothetical protein
MTPAEFERVAAKLAALEDYVQDFAHGLTSAQRQPWDVVLRLAIATHAQLQLELEPEPEIIPMDMPET